MAFILLWGLREDSLWDGVILRSLMMSWNLLELKRGKGGGRAREGKKEGEKEKKGGRKNERSKEWSRKKERRREQQKVKENIQGQSDCLNAWVEGTASVAH